MTTPETLPQLKCRELPVFDVDKLEAVRAVFAASEGCDLRQAWRTEPEPDFAPATVRVGWWGDSLLVFAELADADIFSRATEPNQRMWELGDVLELFLQPAGSPGYVEFHITPNNYRLQLRFPDTAAARRAQAEKRFDHLLLPDGVFSSRTWVQPEHKTWLVLATIPVRVVEVVDRPETGMKWKFSFSRYDYTRGCPKPIHSSTSPHASPDFHRREDWGELTFV